MRLRSPLHHLRGAKSIAVETFLSFFNRSRGSDQAQSALAAALTLSSRENSHFLGTQIHAQVVKLGFDNDTFSQNNLLVMYSRSELLVDTIKLFGEMPKRNLVTWTSVISGAIQNGEYEMGLEIYVKMVASGFRPNEFTFGSVLQACSKLEAFELGSCLHCTSYKIGIHVNFFVASSLLHMYAKFGEVGTAEHVFECLSDPDPACWNAMIGGYVDNGYSHEAIRLVRKMHWQGLLFDQFTFVTALKGSSDTRDLKFGRQVHGLIIQSEMDSVPSVMNALMNMYFKAGKKNSASDIFDKLKQRDIVTWNTVITGFAQDEDLGEAVGVFSDMLLTGMRPNQVTFSVLLRMCGAVCSLSVGNQLYCLAYLLGLTINIVVANSLVSMFSGCGEMEYARYIFESLPIRPVVSWNEMLCGYNLNNCSLYALKFFRHLKESGVDANGFTYSSILGACCKAEHAETTRQIHVSVIKSGFDSNCFVSSSLINAYATFGKIADLLEIFHNINGVDVVSWSSMISAFSQQGHNYEALLFLYCLIEGGEKPDEFILGSVLNACSSLTDFGLSKCIHSFVIKMGYEDQVCVASSVIDTYAKCGDIASSRMAFNKLSNNTDPILYNTMITACAQHGLFLEIVELFKKMKLYNLKPTHATFVSVISACSHLGLVDEGRRIFDSISSIHGMDPSKENFGCFIDLLARNGFLEEAKHAIKQMPFESWPAVWRSLLSGCKVHGNGDLALLAAKNLLQLDPENDAAYILVKNVLSEQGQWGEVELVKNMMKDRGIRKQAGYSWIEM
ncbi:pentatricopeptide repeat-containing protein At3g09040, mitochondrial-like [Aristolochia californica]|uniref:pentatricopeptide repeat-containing protein At3g09040, mitochondrial-like n=1 Tax=Aristolochia californica TaxID=171875 RepID=UPI0035D9EF10